METALAATIAIIGALGFIGGFIALSAIFNGWIFSNLWLWFIVPIFHLPELGIAQAIGVSFVVSCLQAHSKPEDDPKKVAKNITTSWVAKLILLGVAWCLKEWFI